MRDYQRNPAALGALSPEQYFATVGQADDVTTAGVNLDNVFTTIENGGIAAFETAWRQLLDSYPRTRAGTPPVARPVDGRRQPAYRHEWGSDGRQ
jgi:hypothetical protein